MPEATMTTEAGAGFDSKGLGLRAQKKILGKLSSKKVAKAFIDEGTGHVLDNVYSMFKLHYGNKKDAEKVIKNIVKIVVKVGINYRNDQFNQEELQIAASFKCKFHSLCLSVISFHEVDFTYDRTFLKKMIEECRATLHSLVSRHVTDKSKARVDMVFNAFSDQRFIDSIFVQGSKYDSYMDQIVIDMNTLMEEGNL